jgi:hypothetical protein
LDWPQPQPHVNRKQSRQRPTAAHAHPASIPGG